MMKTRIFLYLTLAAALVGSVQLSEALPSLLAHSHHESLVQWGSSSGNSAHNHFTTRSFRGWSDTGEPFSAAGCWDDRTHRFDANGNFDDGHCFINEWAGGTSPRYAFSGTWPANAEARVRDAFAAWSGVNSTNPNLRTGIRFEETANVANAEIEVVWTNMNDNACGGSFNFGTQVLSFDSNPPGGNWDFGFGTGGVANNEWHFYSVALHEVGHAIGLMHQEDLGADIMAPTVGEPGASDCNEDGSTRQFFTAIDVDSQTAVRSLYSQPVANPVTVEVWCDYLYGTYNECFALPSGGTGGYTYHWTNGNTSDTWAGSCYGQSPTVTVTASNGARASATGQCYLY